MNEAIRMQVSAFVDGELPENEAELLVRRLSQDADLRRQVSEYLAIGRIMRGEYSLQGSDALRPVHGEPLADAVRQALVSRSYDVTRAREPWGQRLVDCPTPECAKRRGWL